MRARALLSGRTEIRKSVKPKMQYNRPDNHYEQPLGKIKYSLQFNNFTTIYNKFNQIKKKRQLHTAKMFGDKILVEITNDINEIHF